MKRAILLAMLAAGSGSAGAVAGRSYISTPSSLPEYNRSDWGRWKDADNDCQDTRQEVLIAQSSVEVTLDKKGCRVVSGRWMDPYTGGRFKDPSKLDVDHMVALRDAHESGAYAWAPAQKTDFANNIDDKNHLIAVSRSANRSKGAKGPDEWLPPNRRYRCAYIKEWTRIKQKYGLAVSPAEGSVVAYMSKICLDNRVPALPQG